MRKQPAVIIIARHGARLDAADKNWHLTSATPYDPPLTYGGWLQSRSLGSRIASLLHERETACEHGSSTTDDRSKSATPNDESRELDNTRKHKIIVHSSPFIRCIQTSVAISAGIAQFRKTTAADRRRSRPVLHSGSPLIRASNASPQLTAIPEPERLHISPFDHDNPLPAKLRIAQLRIDAFLGEWLSLDYFENMTPPPSSVLMVASAKAELLRPALETANISISRKSSLGHFPGGWSRDRSPASSTDENERTDLAEMATLSHSLPRRVNTIAHGTATRMGVRQDSLETCSTDLSGSDENSTYVPPTPAYAISNSDPIPAGYVAHAQNACVDVQYQWDSMRPPQDWGNGGEYGEEWSSMHRRFRNGLQRMISWYEEHGTCTNVTDGDREDVDDSDADIVLILVTHGAGCNALIGALTNQPVLLDVGMASLTMAVRKSESREARPATSQLPNQARRRSIDLGIANEFTLELTASIEHLRTPSNPLGMPPLRRDTPFLGANRRSSASPFLEVPSSSTVKADLAGGLHRSASSSHGLRPYPGATRSKLSVGLWGSETASTQGGVSESSSSDSLPNFAGTSEGRKSPTAPSEATGSDGLTSQAAAPPQGPTIQSRLWAGRLENSPKRRWTSADQRGPS